MYIILFCTLLTLYLLPTFIAACRNHNNATPIFLVNIFFGWSGFGWIIALIWSFTNNVKDEFYE